MVLELGAPYGLRFALCRRVPSFGHAGKATLADVGRTMDENESEHCGECESVDMTVKTPDPARPSTGRRRLR